MHRRAFVLLLIVLAAVGLSSCAAVQGVVDTRSALERAGYERPEVRLKTAGDYDFVTVEYDVGDANQVDAARIVWQALPLRFDYVTVEGVRFTRQDLEQRYGPRPAGLDDRTISDELARAGHQVVVAAVAGALGLVVAAGVIGFVAWTVRRRRAQAFPPGWSAPLPGRAMPPGWRPPKIG